MECSRQEYWSGLPFHFLGALSNPGIKPGSPAMQADSLLSEPPEKSIYIYIYIYSFVPLGTGQNVHFLIGLLCLLTDGMFSFAEMCYYSRHSLHIITCLI